MAADAGTVAFASSDPSAGYRLRRATRAFYHETCAPKGDVRSSAPSLPCRRCQPAYARMQAMRSNYINGTWIPSADPGGIDVVNPADQSVIDRVPAGHPADVDAAVQAARTALGSWSATPVAERAERLDAARQLLEQRADSVAATISADMGSP